MATKNWFEARQEGWIGLVDNDEQVYVTADDLIGLREPKKYQTGTLTKSITIGNMCVVDVPLKLNKTKEK